MSEQCIVAVYDDFQDAKQAVEILDRSAFPADQVSFVTSNAPEELDADEQEILQAGDKSEENAAKGAGLGGLFGLLLATPILMIPGVGPVLVAGPLAAGLTGAIVGGFLGGLMGWGVQDDQVERYQQYVYLGKTLVVAHGAPVAVATAEEHLRQTNFAKLDLHATTSADAPEISDEPRE